MKLEVVSTSEAIPLSSVEISGEFYDFFGNIKVKTIFENQCAVPIEAIYKFTLDSSAVIHDFRVKIQDRKLVGVVREKSVAKQTYDSAVANKQTSSLLEKDSSGNYKMSLGNLQKSDIVVIEYSYLVKTITEGGKYKLVVPTNIGEKYSPFNSYSGRNFGQTTHSAKADYKFHMNFTWKSKGKISSVSSSTNPESAIAKVSDNEYTVSVTSTPKSGDFVLSVQADVLNNVYMGQTAEALYSVLISKIPSEDEEISPKEFVFFLDKSGSMDGARIAQAKEALKIFLQSLPEGSKFNVVLFDSSFFTIFEESVEYNEQNKQKCLDELSKVRGDGGTEMYNCINAVITNSIPKQLAKVKAGGIVKIPEHVAGSVANNTTNQMERVYVLLTDGDISDSQRVIDLVDKHNNSTRFFTIGIGSGASRDLIERIANVTNGMHKVVIDEKTTDDVVIEMLTHVYKTHYKDVSVTFDQSTVTYPRKLYPDKYITVFGKQLLESVTTESDINVVVSGTNCSTGEQKIWTILASKSDGVPARFVELLYVNDLIVNRDSKLTKQEKVDLSVRYNIMNEFTSFLVVDDVTNDEPEAMVSVEVPHYTGSQSQLQQQSAQLPFGCAAQSSACYSNGFDSFGSSNCQLESCAAPASYSSQSQSYMRQATSYSSSRGGVGAARGMKLSACSTNSASSSVFDGMGQSIANAFGSAKKSMIRRISSVSSSKSVNSSNCDECDEEDDECDSTNSGDSNKAVASVSNSKMMKESKKQVLTNIMDFQKVDGHFDMTSDSLTILQTDFNIGQLDGFVSANNFDKLVVFNILVLLYLEAKNQISMTMVIRKLKSWLAKISGLTPTLLDTEIQTVRNELSLKLVTV